MQETKRKMVAAMALLPVMAGCTSAGGATAGPQLTQEQERLQGFGLTLVVDAVKAYAPLGVELYADGSDLPFYAKSAQAFRDYMSFPSGRVPMQVRATWRKENQSYIENGRIRYRGPLAGDHTTAVASRIPEAVAQSLRRQGGNLRLKFRLHPNGVLFGWDIERTFNPARDGPWSGYGTLVHTMADGDFREAEIFNGVVVRKGWYIDPRTGQKIETDF